MAETCPNCGKEIPNPTDEICRKIGKAKLDLKEAIAQGAYQKAGILQYGTIPALEAQLKSLNDKDPKMEFTNMFEDLQRGVSNIFYDMEKNFNAWFDQIMRK